MKRILRLFIQMSKISVSSAFAYRANFFVNLSISVLSNLLVPLVTILIYRSGASFPGWTFHEALLIQAAFMLCTGVCAPVFSGMVWVTMYHIREGSYDLLMIKPGSIIALTIANSLDFENIGVLLGGAGMFTYAICYLPAVDAVYWLQFFIFFSSAIILSFGLTLIMAATTFKWIGNSRIFEMYESLTIFGRYPGTIFSRVLSFITSFVFPVATLGFLPAAALLGRTDNVMLLTFLPCAAFATIGVLLFKGMVHKYQSAGG
ncbi:MAG: ABC transporter permease [Eubacteriales bacterium]